MQFLLNPPTRAMITSCAFFSSVVVIVLVAVQDVQGVDYCKIKTCRGTPHTACLYKSPKHAGRCGKVYKSGLSDDEKKKVLDAHNKLRQQVASGKETRGNPGPQPPAKEMPDLVWANELETIAQRWASQCKFEHDKCRDTERFQVGQNIAFLGTTDDVDKLKAEKMVQNWYEEVKNLNNQFVKKFKVVKKPMIGHYTQLVWAETTRIGCGATKYKDGQFNKFYLVCNYAPTGNWMGKPIYKTKSDN